LCFPGQERMARCGIDGDSPWARPPIPSGSAQSAHLPRTSVWRSGAPAWCMCWRSGVLMNGSFPNGGRKNRLETTLSPPPAHVSRRRARDQGAPSRPRAARSKDRDHPAAIAAYLNQEQSLTRSPHQQQSLTRSPHSSLGFTASFCSTRKIFLQTQSDPCTIYSARLGRSFRIGAFRREIGVGLHAALRYPKP
jgi:hypothetical protein